MKRCKECWKLNENPLLKYCMEHWYLNKSMNAYRWSKTIKKVSSKRIKRIKEWWSEKELFLEIWNERPHECVECGKYLKEPKAHNFSHIKSKWSRPDLRLDKNNIELLCFRCHFKKDHWLNYKWPDLD